MPTENRSSNTEMAAGLLPCPFCGGSNLHIEAYSVQPDNYHGARVQCMDCEFDAPCGITLKDGGWSSNPEDAKADAATVWNTRVQPAAQHQGEPYCWSYKIGGEQRFYPTDPRKSNQGAYAELMSDAEPLYRHPPTSDGFSAGDMADQGAKAFAARDPEVEALRAALQFYADRDHFSEDMGSDWDNVSGESANILWHESEAWFVEDGSIARAALSGSAASPVEYGPTPGCKQCEEAEACGLTDCPECDAQLCEDVNGDGVRPDA